MLRSAILVLLAALSAFAQKAPTFDVASVRASQQKGRQDQNSPPPEVSPGSVTMRNTRLVDAIRWAYDVQGFQILGPAWVKEALFDISAKSEKPVTEAEMRVMLQTLLAERFKMTLHRETKELPMLVLTVAKGGPKFKESMGGAAKFGTANMTMTGENAPISEISEFLGRILRMPVMDKTGLKAQYNFVMNIQSYITPEIRANMPRDGSPPIEAQGIISSALQEQLGLKMDSEKTPVEVLVIDKVEQEPTEN